jgi:hypothetical protein
VFEVKRLLCTATAVQSVNCDRAVVKFKHENKPNSFQEDPTFAFVAKNPKEPTF